MKNKIFAYLFVCSVSCVFFASGCDNKTNEEQRAEIAVTNSYLGCAVLDLCGDDTNVLNLAPPGMCPGHFDISPTQVKQLCECKTLLLFEFQRKVEGTLSRIKERGLKTAFVKKPGGLCVPDTYLAVCRSVSEILSSEYPDKKAQYQRRLDVIENDLKLLKQELSGKIRQAGIASAKILTSHHQVDFANWLGLETIETFIGSDVETTAGIDRCIKKAQGQNVQFVIANQQEGTALAKALAERLGARAVVFGNFPEMGDQTNGYHALLRANVDALIRANSGDSIEVAKR